VAVGLERAHAQLLGQGEGLAVVGFGLRALPKLASRSDLTAQVQGIRLVAAFPGRTRQRQRALGEESREMLGVMPLPGSLPPQDPCLDTSA